MRGYEINKKGQADAIIGAANSIGEQMQKKVDNLTAQRDELLAALKNLTCIINKAGLINLTKGVQLGATSWYVKASDAMDYAESVISKHESN